MTRFFYSAILCCSLVVCLSWLRIGHAKSFLDGHRTGFIMGGGVGAGFGNGLQIPVNLKLGGGLSERSLLYGELWSSFDVGAGNTLQTAFTLQPGIGATFYPQPHQGLHFYSQFGPAFNFNYQQPIALTTTTIGVVLGLGWDIIPHLSLSIATRLSAFDKPKYDIYLMIQGLAY